MGRSAEAKKGQRKGDFLAGKYLLEECLGVGGMGEVYRATNVSLGRPVAIKLLSERYVNKEEDVLRFLREARAAAAVRHPNVVDVLDVAREDDGTPFIVQELLSGEDLEHYLQARGGKIPWREALEIMTPVADAVAVAHAQNVTHRDLKPANIFVSRERNMLVPKVLDFGACIFPTIAGRSQAEVRMLVGTPHYMAPEQIVSKQDVDSRSDVWALGVILYEIIVGETPFEADTVKAVLERVKTVSFPRLRSRMSEVPEALDALVAKCTARERLMRFADAGEVHEGLAAIAANLGPASERRGASTFGGSLGKPAESSGRVPSPKRPPTRVRPPRFTLDDIDDIDPTDVLGVDLVGVPPVATPPELNVPGASRFTLSNPGSEPPPSTDVEIPDIPLMLDLPAGHSREALSIPPVLDGALSGSSTASPAASKSRTVDGDERLVHGTSRTEGSNRAPSAPTPQPSSPTSLSPAARTELYVTIAVPALLGYLLVCLVPALRTYVGHGLLGESPVGSGSLAVLGLLSSAYFGSRVIAGDSFRGRYAATAISVLFAMVMIIVTFGASESAQLGVAPPSMAWVSTFLAPIPPLILARRATENARTFWLQRYHKAIGRRHAALASAMLMLSCSLSPLGAVRFLPRTLGGTRTHAPMNP